MDSDHYLAAQRDVESALLQESRRKKRCCPVLSLPNPKLFVVKTLFICAASFAFIPLIAAHDQGRVGAVTYALILVALHILFVIIYFWRVNFRELDHNYRSLAARCLGLGASVYLLYLVAGHLPDNLGKLAIDLLGLCLVHTIVLLLLTVKVMPVDTPTKTVPASSYDQIQVDDYPPTIIHA